MTHLVSNLKFLCFVFLTSIASAQSNCTECEICDVCDLPVALAQGEFVYHGFLSFYHDNVYWTSYTFGVLFEIVIWTHLFLCPVLLTLYYMKRMSDVHFNARKWKSYGGLGISTRKMVWWFSGIILCGHDIIWFLWLPRSNVVYFTFIMHIIFLVGGLLLLWTLWDYRPQDMGRKAARGVDVNPSLAIKQFILDRQAEGDVVDFHISISPDVGDNRDKFVGAAFIDGMQDHDVRVSPDRLTDGGLTVEEVTRKLHRRIYQHLIDFPPFVEAIGKVASRCPTSGGTGFVITDMYHNPTEYNNTEAPGY